MQLIYIFCDLKSIGLLISIKSRRRRSPDRAGSTPGQSACLMKIKPDSGEVLYAIFMSHTPASLHLRTRFLRPDREASAIGRYGFAAGRARAREIAAADLEGRTGERLARGRA